MTEVFVIERVPLLAAMDELVAAVARQWGAGSTEHNLVRDIDGLIRKCPTTAIELQLALSTPSNEGGRS